MSNRPDSFMPLYIADYLGDTSHLSGCAEHGAYLLLIMHYFRTGKPLPADDNTLATIAKCTKQEWMRFGGKLLAMFRLEGTLYHHKRIDEEISNAIAMYEKRKSAALASHHARRLNGKGKAGAKQLHPHSSSLPSVKEEEAARASARGGSAPTPALSNEPGWERDFPRWSAVRAAPWMSPGQWRAFFASAKPNGSETTLIVKTRFDKDQIEHQYGEALAEIFGEPVTIKVVDVSRDSTGAV